MWNDRLKQKLKLLGITYEDAAKACGMGKDGFHLAINNRTFKYEKMIQLADKYKFSMDEFRFDEKDSRVEEAVERYNQIEKKYNEEQNKFIPKQIYDDVKNNYENRISEMKASCESRIADMQGQMKYLQHMLEKGENKRNTKTG